MTLAMVIDALVALAAVFVCTFILAGYVLVRLKRALDEKESGDDGH